jgi:hypothetical protein
MILNRTQLLEGSQSMHTPMLSELENPSAGVFGKLAILSEQLDPEEGAQLQQGQEVSVAQVRTSIYFC